jgi:hypothetical protein
MTRILIIGLLIINLTSCSESYKSVDPTAFNIKISEKTDINTAEELIELYYNYPTDEGTPKIIIKTKEVESNKVQVTLIHDRLEDDSIRAVKIVMTAEQLKNRWIVHEIKKNWKCWDGRGHTNWGADYCN